MSDPTAESLAFQAAELVRLGREDGAIVPLALTSIALSLSAKPAEETRMANVYCPCGGQCHHSANPCSMGCLAADGG